MAEKWKEGDLVTVVAGAVLPNGLKARFAFNGRVRSSGGGNVEIDVDAPLVEDEDGTRFLDRRVKVEEKFVMRARPTDKQVSAWLYMIVGPLLTGLAQERYFLEGQKSPTWRHGSKRCEFVRGIAEYVDASQRPTLAQFLRFNPREKELAEAHDVGVTALETAAADAHARLLDLAEFRALFKRVEEDFKGKKGGYDQIERADHLFAENIINFGAQPALPSHYVYSEAWKKYASDAVRLKEHAAVRDAFVRLNQAVENLSKNVNDLLSALSERRDQLADDYGLPPAPPTNAGSETVETFETF